MRAERAPGRLVVVCPNWVGDLVMATPVLAAALAPEEAGPWSDVRLLVRAHLAGVLADAPFLRDRAPETVVPVDDSRGQVAALRALAPAAALLLGNSFGAALRTWRARVPVRAGAALSGRRVLLTHSVLPPVVGGRRVPIPTAHLMRDVAALLGIHPRSLHPVLGYSQAARATVEEALRVWRGTDDAYVACSPGAAFGASKLWPPASFARALDRLHRDRGWRAVVIGAPAERDLVEAVCAACEHEALPLVGPAWSLELTKALVAGARLLVVGDSGPRWFAAAFDVPCVSVMGPTFPELTASSLELCEVVRSGPLECAPCLERVCPLGHHRCMRELPPASVVAAAERVLAR